MSYETVTILFRYGQDDYTVWDVDLPEALVRQARRASNTATGDLDFILGQLPIQEDGGKDHRCQFLFKDGKALALFTMEMPAGFFEEYRNESCSLRGGKSEVMAEVEEHIQEQAHCWELVM